VPTFCRHNRLLENCPICSKKPRVAATRSAPRRAARPAGAPHRAPRRSVSGGMVTRQMARAPDDGYENELVPGLRSSVDAGRLTDQIAFAAARLAELGDSPPALVGEAARLDDPEEALWLLFQIAYLSPLDGDDPWSGIAAARTTWASGENPDPSAVPLGPRSTHDARRGAAGFEAYRTHAERAGGQVAGLEGEPTWTPQHRFDRAFERLALPGFGRAPRFEFLVMASRLGLADLDPWTLHLSAAPPTDPIALAAKRVLGIGDLVLLQRRSRELAHRLDVPLASLDLALWNFSSPEPTRAGSDAEPSADERARIRAALGLAPDVDE
jgi:hypothetical protein